MKLSTTTLGQHRANILLGYHYCAKKAHYNIHWSLPPITFTGHCRFLGLSQNFGGCLLSSPGASVRPLHTG